MAKIAEVDYFDQNNLKESLNEISDKHSDSQGKSSITTTIESDEKITLISQKCCLGKYNFSPYSLKLFMKGRGKIPREISIPSLQDQAVLKSLDKSLKQYCPLNNATKLAFFLVKDLKEFLKNNQSSLKDLKVMRIDIQQYFDEIGHDKLLEKVKNKRCNKNITELVQKAIATQTVEKGRKSKGLRIKGIPQGVSISSHLADLYLEEFDEHIKNLCIQYYRYVDDILVIYEPKQEHNLEEQISKSLQFLGLKAHEEGGKFYKSDLTDSQGFDFLGYYFYAKQGQAAVSIRDINVQKFVNSIIAIISSYKKGRYQLRYPDTRIAQSMFEFDINEKITGAFKGDRRYGWLWYFRQMDDLSLLDKIDKIIKRELRKDNQTKNIRVKRLKRAFYEIEHFRANKNYILNYGLQDADKIKQLYGDMDAGIRKATTHEEVLKAFNHFTNNRLRRLMLDELKNS